MKYKHDEEQLRAHLANRVDMGQFMTLVAYWESAEGMVSINLSNILV